MLRWRVNVVCKLWKFKKDTKNDSFERATPFWVKQLYVSVLNLYGFLGFWLAAVTPQGASKPLVAKRQPWIGPKEWGLDKYLLFEIGFYSVAISVISSWVHHGTSTELNIMYIQVSCTSLLRNTTFLAKSYSPDSIIWTPNQKEKISILKSIFWGKSVSFDITNNLLYESKASWWFTLF